MMMTMVNSGHEDLAKQRMLQARALCQEVRGGGLNLGKKVSIPRDVMMEELNLESNRGSRMFQQRQRRVEKFTVENTINSQVFQEAIPPPQYIPVPEPQGGRENQGFSIPGKHSLVMNLQKSVAKKGSPQGIAPGYSGPLQHIPHEKFNMTIIPKLYSSPWKEALGDSREELVFSQLPEPPQRLPPENYRCFNRSAMPFCGPMASNRVIPVVNLEALQAQNLPSMTEDHFSQRPSFNRAPKGWGNAY